MHRHEKTAKTLESKQLGSAQGTGWRFDRYQIKDSSIQPAPGARLEWYDPWAEFGTSRKYNDVPPPYQSLLRLAPELRPQAPRFPDRVAPAAQESIVEWCQKYGPLGVLLSQWEAVTLAAQRGEAAQFTSTRYVRAFGQQIYEIQSSGDFGDRKPSVLLHGLDDLTLVEEPLDQTWSKFFPGVEPAKRKDVAFGLATRLCQCCQLPFVS